MTTDEITGATPSAFYAHEPERDNSDAILEDLALSQINFYVSSKAIKIPMLGIPQKGQCSVWVAMPPEIEIKC